MVRTIILNFHGVGETTRRLDPGEADVWVSRDAFERLLDAVSGRDDVRITFDDGNASDCEHALPALRERGLTATFFVCGGRVGQPGFLDAARVNELADAGMRIGSHGMDHRRWRGLSDDDLHTEVVRAKATLEEIVERPVTEAACPFGAYDRRVLRTLRESGFDRVYTSDRGTARPDAFLQARNSVGPSDGSELLTRIESLDGGPHKVLGRRAKLAVKRWR